MNTEGKLLFLAKIGSFGIRSLRFLRNVTHENSEEGLPDDIRESISGSRGLPHIHDSADLHSRCISCTRVVRPSPRGSYILLR
jgi:hypothetical protein